MNYEILKRTKTTMNLKSGLNKSNVLNFFETRVYLDKLRVSLKKNLRKFFFNQRITSNDLNVDRFIQEHVLIDSHYFNTVRNETILYVEPIQYNEGRHSIRNGLSRNFRDRRGITSIEQNGIVPHNVMVLVFVHQYELGGSIHEGHAICAFKHGNVLYCFNPWGSQYVLKNRHTGNVLPDNAIWEHLRRRYRCDYAMVYTGTDFQANNTKGVCVGLSVDFGTYMYTHLMLQQKNFPDLSTAINGIPGSNILFSHEYNTFVEFLFYEYIGAFNNTIHTGNSRCSMIFNKLTSNTVSTRTSSVNNNNVNIKRIIQKLNKEDQVFKQSMNDANWKETNYTRITDKQRNARTNVRARLQEFDNRLLKVHGNTLNAEIRKYVVT